MRGNARVLLVLLAVGGLFIGACGGDDTPPSDGSDTGSGVSLVVTLQEWGVIPARSTVKGGKITFIAENKGPKRVHEFVVLKTDLNAAALPSNADGSVNEKGAGVQTIGELEEIAVGTSKNRVFDLTAGNYVLFCNRVETEAMPETGGIKSHYRLGMRTAFTVT